MKSTLTSLILAGVLSLLGVTVTASGDGIIDLKKLADGETKTYGDGDHKITATRHGDKIDITLPEKDGKEHKMTVDVKDGDAMVMTLEDGKDGDAQVHKVIVKKTGKGTEDVDVLSSGVLVGDGALVVKTGDGDDERVVVKKIVGDASLDLGDLDDMTILRCPEGDTTMRVDKGDENALFTCPKHGKALEKVEGGKGFKTIVVTKTIDEKDGKDAK
ncbi:MAG: hypothetical protein U0166_21820 [Acidobacteriota bacterium]